MAKLGIEAATAISVILGVILLSILGISGIFTLLILGFVATYLTKPNERTYKSGGIAGIILALLIFIYGLFISPILPITPPSLSLDIMINLQLSGLFNLVLGLIFSVLICYLFGSLGGLTAQKILKKKIKKPEDYHKRSFNKKPKKKKLLNKSFKN